MRIRPATSSDCSAIRSAYLTSWRAGYQDLLSWAEIDVQARVRSLHDWGSTINQPDRVVLVAEDASGSILGVVECEHAPSRDRLPWLHMLYVIPSAWGNGTATGLLHEALDATQEAGHRSVWLEVVGRQMRARRFYEREGFMLDDTMEPGFNGLFDLLRYRHDQPAPERRANSCCGSAPERRVVVVVVVV